MTNFNFPIGIDSFTPTLVNDFTVVNANHVQDLRNSIYAIENALVGSTPFPYNSTTIVFTGDNLQTAISKLDHHLSALETQLGFVFDAYSSDGYSGRVDELEGEFHAHRSSSGPIDSYGASVHGVDGNVVGTNNSQDLINKRVDSGLTQTGPKFVARGGPSDYSDGYSGRQIEIFGISGDLNAWIDEQGDAYFAGDLIVEGNKILKGVDVIQQSLFVDGYSILGNDPTLDYINAFGSFTLNGTSGQTLNVSNTGDITGSGATVSLGDGTGILTLNFTQTNLSGNETVAGTLAVNGVSTLADITMTGALIQTGNFYTSGDFWALGTGFKVEGGSNSTTVNTAQLIINSTTSTWGASKIILNSSGDISADGTTYSFGNVVSLNTNTFVVNANASIGGDLLVSGSNINATTSTATVSSLISAALTVNGNTILNDGSQQSGYVWTASGGSGLGSWMPTQRWNTTSQTSAYVASSHDEVLANTTSAPFIVTLPSTPASGDRVRIVDNNGASGSWSTNNLTVSASGGKTIRGAATLVLSTSNTWIEAVYNGVSDWVVMS